MWTYHQKTGDFLDPNGERVATGYAGRGKGKNNPDMQHVKMEGPIPCGLWKMVSIRDSGNTGPFTIVLEPMPGTETFGRGDFRVHGDSKSSPGNASHGCPITSRPIRERMWYSTDHVLEVRP
jgi:hypothetical protein